MYSTEFNLKGKNVKLSKEKLLTIGIITKNECEKLERCLKSLMPIKEALDCEIIVTDTGSTDNTVEMSKKYADKVIKFDWIDDFSAARNIGIEASKGLWFMWIDSDEWVDDPKPLIDFFKGGDYKKYASATIEMLDSGTGDDNNIGVTLARMLLLAKNIKFEGPIHENIAMMGPRKNIDIVFFHDGYAFKNTEDKKEKHNRNLDILLKMYNDDPDDLRVIRYVIDQYRFMNEFEKANELCDRGIGLIEKKVEHNDADKAYELHFNIMKAANYLSMNKLQECIDILNVLEDVNPKNSRRFLDIYFMLSEAYFRLGQISKSSKFAKKYVESYIKRSNMDNSYSTTFYETSNKLDVVQKMFLLSFESIQFKNEVSSIQKYIDDFKSARLENNMPQNDEEYVLNLFKIIDITKSMELFVYGYDQIKNENIEFNLDRYSELIFEYMVLNKENIYVISKESLKIKEDYELYNIASFIISDLDNEIELAKKNLLTMMGSDFVKNKYIVVELFYGMCKYNVAFESIVNLIDSYNLKNIFKLSIREDEELIDNIIKYYNNNNLTNIKYIVSMINILDEYVVNGKIEKKRLLEIYRIYDEILPKAINTMYGNNLNEDYMDIYPPVYRFGYFLSKANDFKKKNDSVEYIKTLKKSIKEYPYMEYVVKLELEDFEKSLALENERKNEFEELAVKIKQKIYELITLGECEEALTVVCQLQSIMPNDSELKELKSRLTSF